MLLIICHFNYYNFYNLDFDNGVKRKKKLDYYVSTLRAISFQIFNKKDQHHTYGSLSQKY